MTSYDNFAQTFSQSRKNMKWEEIEYFLTKYAPFGNVLDVGCGNGRLFWELLNVIPAQAGLYPSGWIYKNGKNTLIDSVINTEWQVSQCHFDVRRNPLDGVWEIEQSIRNPRVRKDDKSLFSSYIWIDSSEKLLEEANKSYLVLPAEAGIYKKEETILKDSTPNGEWQKELKFFFQLLDMKDISELQENSFDTIFFIASFHHLEKPEERLQVLQDTKNLLKIWGKIFLTNWALESDFNREKYKHSKIQWSENEFWGTDFQIKIWEFQRYYHSFTVWELEEISKKAWFEVIENRLFETERNFVTILQKKEH